MLPPNFLFTDNLSWFITQIKDRTHDCSFLIYCQAGKLQLRISGRTYELTPQQLLLMSPGYKIEDYSGTRDCACKMIATRGELRMELSHFCMREDSRWWEKSRYVREHPVFSVSNRQKEVGVLFGQFYALYSSYQPSSLSDRIVRAIIEAGLLELMSWIGDAMPESYTESNHGRIDILFRRFLMAIQKNQGKKREVQWYAEQLAITPKYLTTICHTISGKSASTIINESTVMELKRLLLQTDMSSKEICEELEFITPSFFCKYVKRELGMSTKQFRRMNRK